MSQAGALNNNSGGGTPGDVAINFITDSGTAVPVGNNINVNGSNGLTTSGSGNQIIVNPNSYFLQARYGSDQPNVTGDGTQFNLAWNAINYQSFGSLYNPATGVWTSPLTYGGWVQFNYTVGLSGLTSSHVYGIITVTENEFGQTWAQEFNPAALMNSVNTANVSMNVLFNFTQNVQHTFALKVSSGAKTVGIRGFSFNVNYSYLNVNILARQ